MPDALDMATCAYQKTCAARVQIDVAHAEEADMVDRHLASITLTDAEGKSRPLATRGDGS